MGIFLRSEHSSIFTDGGAVLMYGGNCRLSDGVERTIVEGDFLVLKRTYDEIIFRVDSFIFNRTFKVPDSVVREVVPYQRFGYSLAQKRPASNLRDIDPVECRLPTVEDFLKMDGLQETHKSAVEFVNLQKTYHEYFPKCHIESVCLSCLNHLYLFPSVSLGNYEKEDFLGEGFLEITEEENLTKEIKRNGVFDESSPRLRTWMTRATTNRDEDKLKEEFTLRKIVEL